MGSRQPVKLPQVSAVRLEDWYLQSPRASPSSSLAVARKQANGQVAQRVTTLAGGCNSLFTTNCHQ